MLRKEFSRRFRALLSGSANGVPAWTPDVLNGSDAGLFGPEDAPWIVHADLATLVGGVRALIMQALHPGSLAGVVQHSRYEEDVIGRLNGTIRWLTISTYGARDTIEAEAARVRAMHDRVRGRYVGAEGDMHTYRASDTDLLQWVHIAFTDSFLAVHRAYGRRPVSQDDYVRLWGQAVAPLGLTEVPTSLAELQAEIHRFVPHLVIDERTRKVLAFVRRAPLPRGARPVYRLVYWAAVDSLPDEIRRQLPLPCPPRWLVRPATHLLLGAMRLVLGDRSPVEDAALERLQRLGLLPRGSARV